MDATIADQPEQDHGLNPNEQHLQLALASAERKLAEARLQIAELEALLDEIPEIFERKFEQRLQPVLERQELLLNDNAELRRKWGGGVMGQKSNHVIEKREKALAIEQAKKLGLQA